jgi:hypothetical protein
MPMWTRLFRHYAMLQRNLLYTGVTRGKKLVVLVGQPKAVAIAVKNVSGRRRWSKLKDWLRSGGQRDALLAQAGSATARYHARGSFTHSSGTPVIRSSSCSSPAGCRP